MASHSLIWPLAGLTLPANLTHAGRFFVQLQQTFAVLRIAIFLGLAGFSQLLSIGWRNRELQIAKYLLKGYSSTQIKDTLNLHSSTVGTHKIRTFEKLKIRNVFELRELANLYQLDLSKI